MVANQASKFEIEVITEVITDRLENATLEKVRKSENIVTSEASQEVATFKKIVTSEKVPTSENKVEIRFADPRKDPPQIFEVRLRKNLPRIIEKCRGGCGVKIKPNDPGMLIRTYGTTRWTNKTRGEEDSKHGPMYIHFQEECLRRYDSTTHYGANNSFDYSKLTVDKKVHSELNEDEKNFLISLGVHFV